MRVTIPPGNSCPGRFNSPARSLPVMSELEPRQLFAGSGTVIHIGPTEAIKTLDAAPWPKQGSNATVTFLVDYSPMPYATAHHAVFGNVTIEPSDPSKPPTLLLQPTNYPTF